MRVRPSPLPARSPVPPDVSGPRWSERDPGGMLLDALVARLPDDLGDTEAVELIVAAERVTARRLPATLGALRAGRID